MLIRHLSPPVLRGYFPLQDTGTIKCLSLTGVRLYRNKKKFFRMLTHLKRNPRYTSPFNTFVKIQAKRTWLVSSWRYSPSRNISKFWLFRGDQKILTCILQWCPMRNPICNRRYTTQCFYLKITLYFMLKFSSLPTKGSDIQRIPVCRVVKPTSFWETMEYQSHP